MERNGPGESFYRKIQKGLRQLSGVPDTAGRVGSVGKPEGKIAPSQVGRHVPELNRDGPQKRNESELTPEFESLCGLAPEVREIEMGVKMYTFSGKELRERGAEPGSVHAARLALPWGGEMYLYSRMSPGHEAQDAMSVIVDTKHRLVMYARLDGVSDIGNDRGGRRMRNDSATLAHNISTGIERIHPGDIAADDGGHVDGKRWRAQIELMIDSRVRQFSQVLGGKGAVTGEFGMITARKEPDGRFVWDKDMLRIGATEKVSRDEYGRIKHSTGDFGGHEMFAGIGYPSFEMWDRDRERSFVKVTDDGELEYRSHYQRRSFVRSETDILSVSHTDGMKAIESDGGLKRVGQFLLDSVERARRKLTDYYEATKNRKMVSGIDDISALVLKLKGKRA